MRPRTADRVEGVCPKSYSDRERGILGREIGPSLRRVTTRISVFRHSGYLLRLSPFAFRLVLHFERAENSSSARRTADAVVWRATASAARMHDVDLRRTRATVRTSSLRLWSSSRTADGVESNRTFVSRNTVAIVEYGRSDSDVTPDEVVVVIDERLCAYRRAIVVAIDER